MAKTDVILAIRGGRRITNANMMPGALRQTRPTRENSNDAAESIEKLLEQRALLLAACRAVNSCGNGGARLSREASDQVRAAIKAADYNPILDPNMGF